MDNLPTFITNSLGRNTLATVFITEYRKAGHSVTTNFKNSMNYYIYA